MQKYIFKPYNNLFPVLFSKEKERIAPHLPQGMSIEHVGSSAVPGLGGKGIIDIAIEARGLYESLQGYPIGYYALMFGEKTTADEGNP